MEIFKWISIACFFAAFLALWVTLRLGDHPFRRTVRAEVKARRLEQLHPGLTTEDYNWLEWQYELAGVPRFPRRVEENHPLHIASGTLTLGCRDCWDYEQDGISSQQALENAEVAGTLLGSVGDPSHKYRP